MRMSDGEVTAHLQMYVFQRCFLETRFLKTEKCQRLIMMLQSYTKYGAVRISYKYGTRALKA